MKLKPVFYNIYTKSILAAILIVVVLLWGTFKWMAVYTKHGKAVEVPDVRGLQVQQAAPFFEKNSVQFTVVDSIYSTQLPPGSIVETVPPSKSKVKEGRNIFVTINAVNPRQIIVPEVQDRSQREALATLRALGFSNINVEYVSAPYKDLVISLNHNNKIVQGGSRLPINSKLVLKVSNGNKEHISYSDSISSTTDPQQEES